MRVSAKYNELLASKGVSLAKMNVRDIGLFRDDALLAIGFLRDADIPILGGEVWRRRDSKFELTYENWHTNSSPMEDQQTYSQRSCEAAEQYIRGFPEQADVELLFVLVIRS